MSSYPHNPPYGVNPNPSYLPPTYPNQYLQQSDEGRTGHGQMANSYGANMNAYDYNRAAPTFSPAAVASGVPPLPIFQGWNTDAMPLPPYTAPQNGGQYNNGYVENVQPQQYYPPAAQPSYQQHQHQGYQNKTYEHDADEGEFDDGSAANSVPSVGYGATQYRGNDGTGYIDTAQRALYPRAQDYSPQQSYPANNYNYPPRDQAQTRRQPSGSYSPYGAATVPNNAERPSGAHHQSTYPQGQLKEPVVPSPVVPIPVAVPAKPFIWQGSQKSAQQAEHKSLPNKPFPSQKGAKPTQHATPAAAAVKTTTSAASKGVDEVLGKSIAEERKIAQGAILKAWPLGIHLKAYLEEGIEEDVVKRLFIESNLSPSSNESGYGENIPISQQQKPPFQALPKSQNGTLAGAPGTSKNGQAAIPPLSVITNGSTGTMASPAQTPTTPTTVVAPKSVSMIEKDKALKSKMEALKKSREDRAQKAAARSGSSSRLPVAAVGQETVPKGLPESDKAAVQEPSLVFSTNSLSKSPSIPKNDLRLPAKPSFIKDLEPVAKPVSTQHQLPAIPGLFLSSSAPTPAPQLPSKSAIHSPVQGNLRKRPVAADFDESISSMAAFKRPFGQNRHDTPLVIDVSEDEMDSEDEDVAMDLESVADDTPAQLTSKQSDNSLLTAQNQPTSKPRSPPSFASAISTPPVSQQTSRPLPARPGPEGAFEQKMSEIEKLKKKLAELEAKKKSKRTNSGAQTPRAIETVAADANIIPQETGDPLVQQVLPAIPQQSLVDEAALKEQRKQVELRVVEAATLAEEKRRISAEKKRMQRNKMASDIAALRAADEQKLQEIERRRAEVEQMEALRIQNLKNQRRLEEQMLLLAEDEEEEEHSSQANESVPNEATEIPTLEAQDKHTPNHLIPTNEERTRQLSVFTSEQNANKESSDAAVASEPGEIIEPTSEDVEDVTQVNGVSSLTSDDYPTSANGTHQSDDQAETSRPASEDRVGDSKTALSADQALEAALQEAARIEADSHANNEEDIDMEISYTAEPVEIEEPISEAMEEVPNSPEYSPELHRDIPEVLDIPDRESDDYEPPEATPPIAKALNDEVVDAPPTVRSPSPIDSPPFSPAPPAEILEPVEDMVLDDNPAHVPDEKASEIEIYDEQAPVADAGQSQMAEVKTPDEPVLGARAFVPYDSPLKHFRAYRFHPRFKQEIPGGLRSTTYSHKINPNKEFCRYELAGGVCNDNTCDLQHFKEINILDDAVLTTLGSPDEFQGEQRDRFCVGLKEVLMRMRVNKVRDFNKIASEIIAHRVKFLGDDSKVLPLEGTNI